jgi:cation diffusion facilitator family transporter
MHSHSLDQWTHDHVFLGAQHARNERRTWFVVALTVIMMVGEIAAGSFLGSMALLADGWHMATHVGALGLSSLAYWYARRAGGAGRFAFGPGKVATLAGYTNALILAGVALFMLVEAVGRILAPQPVRFAEALPVAIIGLVVNLVSAWILSPEHDDDHHDHNLRSAYVHVLADVLTSVLAIGALTVGYFAGTARLDAASALIGAVVILWWALGLLRTSVPELIDIRIDAGMTASLRERLEADGLTSIKEIRVWPLGSGRKACHLGLASATPRSLEEYRQLVLETISVDHVAIEIHRIEVVTVRESA